MGDPIQLRDGKVRFGSEILANREPDHRFGLKWSDSGSQGVQTRTGPFFFFFFLFSF